MESENQPGGGTDPGEPAANENSLHVLMVENHSDTRLGVKVFLRMLGHRTSCAESAAAALVLAGSTRFDVLLSDISLPDGDGWSLLAQLEARGLRPAHAIAMSGLGSAADRARSRAAGFERHLVKPFAPEALEEALEQVAARRAGHPGKQEAATPGAPPMEPGEGWRQQMHDGLCQQLAAASLLQEALIRRLEKLTGADAGGKPLEEAIAEARHISQVLDDALAESRALMRGT